MTERYVIRDKERVTIKDLKKGETFEFEDTPGQVWEATSDPVLTDSIGENYERMWGIMASQVVFSSEMASHSSVTAEGTVTRQGEAKIGGMLKMTLDEDKIKVIRKGDRTP